MNRTGFAKIPGKLIIGGQSFLSKLGTAIERRLVHEVFEVGTDAAGPIDTRDREAYYRVSMTPDGRITAGIISALWPYANPTVGSKMFSDTDVPLYIHGNDASLDTFAAAALEVMPAITFSSVDTLVGQATWLCFRETTVGAGPLQSWADGELLASQADTGGTATDSGLTAAGIITQPYVLNWTGMTGFLTADDVQTLDGFHFEPTVNWSDVMTDSLGLINKTLSTVTCRLRFTPMGPTRQEILTALKIQGAGASRGRSHTAGGAALTITGANGVTYLTIPNASLVDSVTMNGTEQLREGELAFVANRTLSAGVPQTYFTVAAS